MKCQTILKMMSIIYRKRYARMVKLADTKDF